MKVCDSETDDEVGGRVAAARRWVEVAVGRCGHRCLNVQRGSGYSRFEEPLLVVRCTLHVETNSLTSGGSRPRKDEWQQIRVRFGPISKLNHGAGIRSAWDRGR